jgi:hypothetical protein
MIRSEKRPEQKDRESYKNTQGPSGQTVRNVRDLSFSVPDHFETAIDKDHYETRNKKR